MSLGIVRANLRQTEVVQAACLGIGRRSASTRAELGELRGATLELGDAAARGRVAGTEVYCVVHAYFAAIRARVRAVRGGTGLGLFCQTQVVQTACLGVSGFVTFTSKDRFESCVAIRKLVVAVSAGGSESSTEVRRVQGWRSDARAAAGLARVWAMSRGAVRAKLRQTEVVQAARLGIGTSSASTLAELVEICGAT